MARNFRTKAIAAAVGAAMVAIVLVWSLLMLAPNGNGPSLRQGDFWVYEMRAGQANVTVRQAVGSELPTIFYAKGPAVRLLPVYTSLIFPGSSDPPPTRRVTLLLPDLAFCPLNEGIQVVCEGGGIRQAFPLSVGTWWSESRTLGLTGDILTSGIVLAWEEIEVPAGAFRVLLVKASGPGIPRALFHYSEQVGNMVRLEYFDAQGIKLSSLSLQSYSYAGWDAKVGLITLGNIVFDGVAIGVVVVTYKRKARVDW